MLATQAIAGPGDRVVEVTPLWPNLVEQPKIVGAAVECIPLGFGAGGWTLDLDRLLAALTPAIEHQGAAFIDVISPCVAFNNHPGSTKSYDYVREHNEAVNFLDIMPPRAPITTKYAPGSVQAVMMHDGSTLVLHKVHDGYDPHDRIAAMNHLAEHQAKGQVVTGLLYVEREPEDLHGNLNTVDTPLNKLGELCPGSATLEKFNASLR